MSDAAHATALSIPSPPWTRATLSELARAIYANGSRLSLQRQVTTVYRPLYGSFVEILDWIPPRARLVDIGCGTGALLLLAAALRELRSGFGCDANAASIAIATAANRWPQVQFAVTADLPEAVIADSNVVCLIDVLHHIPVAQQRPFLERLLSLLAPGTTLIIKDLHPTPHWRAMANRVTDFLSTRSLVEYIAMEDVAAIATQQGLHVREQQRFNLYVWSVYFVVVEKPASVIPA